MMATSARHGTTSVAGIQTLARAHIVVLLASQDVLVMRARQHAHQFLDLARTKRHTEKGTSFENEKQHDPAERLPERHGIPPCKGGRIVSD
jgi:hypothetical protein